MAKIRSHLLWPRLGPIYNGKDWVPFIMVRLSPIYAKIRSHLLWQRLGPIYYGKD